MKGPTSENWAHDGEAKHQYSKLLDLFEVYFRTSPLLPFARIVLIVGASHISEFTETPHTRTRARFNSLFTKRIMRQTRSPTTAAMYSTYKTMFSRPSYFLFHSEWHLVAQSNNRVEETEETGSSLEYGCNTSHPSNPSRICLLDGTPPIRVCQIFRVLGGIGLMRRDECD
jgi:hypothetical protein